MTLITTTNNIMVLLNGRRLGVVSSMLIPKRMIQKYSCSFSSSSSSSPYHYGYRNHRPLSILGNIQRDYGIDNTMIQNNNDFCHSWKCPRSFHYSTTISKKKLWTTNRRRITTSRKYSNSNNNNNNSNCHTDHSTSKINDNDSFPSLKQEPNSNTTTTNSTTTTTTTTTATSSSSSSSATTSTTTTNFPSNAFFNQFRQSVGLAFSIVGFLSSSVASIVQNPRRFWDQTQQPLQAFRSFLKTSSIDIEWKEGIVQNRQLLLHLALLARIRQKTISTTISSSLSSEKTDQEANVEDDYHDQWNDEEFWKQARRYVRYATAVYGQAMIRAVTVDARGRFDQVAQSFRQQHTTLQAISNHVGVPTQDLITVQVDMDYRPDNDNTNNGQSSHHHSVLRHLIAIDHDHQEIVLALRGTFSLQEIVVDIAGFSREEFCGIGQAHEGMAEMAEQVWNVAGPTICKILEQQHPNYDLVVTGHSLGAGTASLLTILLKHQQKQRIKQQQQQQNEQSDSLAETDTTSSNDEPEGSVLPLHTNVKCFAFACPPVFTPLQAIPQTLPVITNIIHDTDVVPFLSVYSVRHLLVELKTVQELVQDWSWNQKWAVALGTQLPPDDLIHAFTANKEERQQKVLPKRGAPQLQIPAGKTVWLRPSFSLSSSSSSSSFHPKKQHYQSSIWKTLPSTIPIGLYILSDHFPQRYEYALDHVDLPEEHRKE